MPRVLGHETEVLAPAYLVRLGTNFLASVALPRLRIEFGEKPSRPSQKKNAFVQVTTVKPLDQESTVGHQL
jgi:hypothetical protein